MSNYVFNNLVSSIPFNPNVAFNNSWITVGNNAGRELYANASYITNLDDISISLQAGNLDIGAVHIIDKDSGLAVSVADVGAGLGAIRVLSQDLESVHDVVGLGDLSGNRVGVTNSALNVFVTNGISAVSITNFPTQLTAVSVTNFPTQLTAVSVTNFPTQLTAVSVTNFPTQLTAVSVTNQLTSTSVTVLNPVSAFTLVNPISNFDIVACNLTLPVSGEVTITNNLSGNVGVSMASNWGITIAAVTSSAYVQFPSVSANIASLMNTTGGILYVGKWNSSSTVGLPLLNNSSIEINLTGNTNEIGVKSTLSGTVSAYAMYTKWNNN